MTTEDSVRPGRILLVEDDHDAALYAVHVLTTMGRFDVSHTADPQVALERARSEHWDLVLTDLDLPGMTGLDLLRALRCAAPALPVAVVTADVTPGPGLGIARRQADAFLQKPVSPDQLVTVARALTAAGRRFLSCSLGLFAATPEAHSIFQQMTIFSRRRNRSRIKEFALH